MLLDLREAPRDGERQHRPSTPRRSTARTPSTSNCPRAASTAGAGMTSRPAISPSLSRRSGRSPSRWWQTTRASRSRAPESTLAQRILGGWESSLAEQTDAAGKVVLGLPPGHYAGIWSDPPIETRYIRTYQRPLVVERGEGSQRYEIRQKAGVELIFQAVGVRAGNPVAGAFFWKAPEDQPEETQHIETSTLLVERALGPTRRENCGPCSPPSPAGATASDSRASMRRTCPPASPRKRRTSRATRHFPPRAHRSS